jgi:hypothetical protein
MNKLFKYLLRVGDALSQLANVLVFFGKNANESVSGRAYRLRNLSWPWAVVYQLINFIFVCQKNHCRSAYFSDRQKAKRMLEQ